jgi:hypothetical protein
VDITPEARSALEALKEKLMGPVKVQQAQERNSTPPAKKPKRVTHGTPAPPQPVSGKPSGLPASEAIRRMKGNA